MPKRRRIADFMISKHTREDGFQVGLGSVSRLRSSLPEACMEYMRHGTTVGAWASSGGPSLCHLTQTATRLTVRSMEIVHDLGEISRLVRPRAPANTPRKRAPCWMSVRKWLLQPEDDQQIDADRSCRHARPVAVHTAIFHPSQCGIKDVDRYQIPTYKPRLAEDMRTCLCVVSTYTFPDTVSLRRRSRISASCR